MYVGVKSYSEHTGHLSWFTLRYSSTLSSHYTDSFSRLCNSLPPKRSPAGIILHVSLHKLRFLDCRQLTVGDPEVWLWRQRRRSRQLMWELELFKGGKPELLRQGVRSPKLHLKSVSSAEVTVRSEPRWDVGDAEVCSTFHIPAVSCSGPALLFLTSPWYWTAVKDWLLEAHGIPLHLAPAWWASCKAGRLQQPPRPPCPTPSQPWLGNDSLIPQRDIQIISKSLLPGWCPHPQLSVNTQHARML